MMPSVISWKHSVYQMTGREGDTTEKNLAPPAEPCCDFYEDSIGQHAGR